MFERLIENLLTALDKQTLIAPGTETAALIVPSPAGSLRAFLDQPKLLEKPIQELLDEHPLPKIPHLHARHRHQDRSPGPDRRRRRQRVPDRRPPRLLRPPPPTAPAPPYAASPSRRGNKQLKQALFPAAFASLSDPVPAGLPRQEDRPGQTPHPNPPPPGQTPGRHPSSPCSATPPSTNHDQHPQPHQARNQARNQGSAYRSDPSPRSR